MFLNIEKKFNDLCPEEDFKNLASFLVNVAGIHSLDDSLWFSNFSTTYDLCVFFTSSSNFLFIGNHENRELKHFDISTN